MTIRQLHCVSGTFLNSRVDNATGIVNDNATGIVNDNATGDGVGVVTFSQSHHCDCMMPKPIVQIQH